MTPFHSAVGLLLTSLWAQAENPTVSHSSATALRGVHLTGWTAGVPAARARFIGEMKAAGLNAVAVALKEYDGSVFVKGVLQTREIGAYVNAIPDLPACVADFKRAGIYTIGRIAVFKDDKLARRKPEWAVRRPDGSVWANDKGTAWTDPYRREVWEYNLAIASAAVSAGFDEIQFDYIRFPSDGETRQCRYSRADHSSASAARNLKEFLILARERLKPRGVKISLCLFGLTTSVNTGMGIGQRMGELASLADYVAPMMYPSHYAKGEMGIKNPNKEPYKTISRGLKDAVASLGAEASRLRPYLQDFSLGVRYKAAEVRGQIMAAEAQGVNSWMLWNPQNRYTWEALRLNGRPVWEQPLRGENQ